MSYLRLFTAFMKIGFTSFGGMSMIPVIMQEMKVNQWMTAEDLTNLIAIAEMTPGPLGINCATFAGMQTAGVPGGIAAVMGVLMPAYTLTLGVAVCFAKFHVKIYTGSETYYAKGTLKIRCSVGRKMPSVPIPIENSSEEETKNGD